MQILAGNFPYIIFCLRKALMFDATFVASALFKFGTKSASMLSTNRVILAQEKHYDARENSTRRSFISTLNRNTLTALTL